MKVSMKETPSETYIKFNVCPFTDVELLNKQKKIKKPLFKHFYWLLIFLEYTL